MTTHPPLGSGVQAMLDDLHIKVDVAEGGWRYRIFRANRELEKHNPCWPWSQTEETAKVEAVGKALEVLKKGDDPQRVATGLDWKPI